MKRTTIFYLMVAILSGFSLNCMAQTTQTPKQLARAQARAARKAATQAENAEAFQKAENAIDEKNWVLTANTVYGPDGNSYVVSGMTNFIQFDGNTVYLQLAFNDVVNGPNGLGGITLEGSPSSMQKTTTANGGIIYDFDVNGMTLNADVQITVNAGNNYATGTVYPAFSPNNLTFSGYLVPTSESGIFRSGFVTP
ncbi:MAG: DUF4251 domain-containing protein [Marinifilaceae bacterium]|nr:DUF4251 domain-containing protein [Marinifilaceae bacterium]